MRRGRWAHSSAWLGPLAAASALLVQSAAPLADLRETPHNLVRAGTGDADEQALCMFCHTPRPEAGAVPVRPLWQRAITGDHAFATYDDAQYVQEPGIAGRSPSLVCLSCHDANQAPGNFGLTGLRPPFTYEHPFGVPYGGIVARPGARDAAIAARQAAGEPVRPARSAIRGAREFRPATASIIGERRVWWVAVSGAAAQRRRTDLPLYTRADIAAPEEVAFVECSTCHDPHATTPRFLRIDSASSRLCLTCHDR